MMTGFETQETARKLASYSRRGVAVRATGSGPQAMGVAPHEKVPLTALARAWTDGWWPLSEFAA